MWLKILTLSVLFMEFVVETVQGINILLNMKQPAAI